MKRKKLAFLFLVFLLAFIPLLACSNEEKASSDSKNGEKVELEFWTINLKKNFNDYIQGMINDYEKANPNIKIKWVDVPGADASKKFLTSLQSRKVPDVVNLASSDISMIQQYNVLSPLNKLISKDELNAYIPGLIDSLTFQDELQGLPWYYGGPPIGTINTEVYKKAGLDPNNPPKTWEESLENGKMIHEKLPKVYGSNDMPGIEVFVSQGLPILNDDHTKAVFNSDEHVKFVQMFVDGYKNGAIAPGAVTKDDRQLQQTYENKQQAQAGQSVAATLLNLEKNAPNEIKKIKVTKPVTGGDGTVAVKAIQTFVVPKKSEHPKEAAKFALFVTNAKNQLDFAKLVPIFPSTTETLEDPFFKESKGKTIHDEARKIMVETAPHLKVNILGIKDEEKLRDYFTEQIRAALMGEQSAKEALDKSVDYWNQALKNQK
ncbi:carbohydrate ABC transporter substrate-binding protein, CUT1 family [Bacillus sp. OV194]|nr:carbohydrate ABC transporter substrate-binding protein, CUT1 family [Bacillus sp. OV194]